MESVTNLESHNLNLTMSRTPYFVSIFVTGSNSSTTPIKSNLYAIILISKQGRSNIYTFRLAVRMTNI